MIASCYGAHNGSLTLKNEHHRQEKFCSSWQTIKKSVDLWSTSGDLSEWFKVRCWKRRVVHATMSSNLIVSARWKAPLHDSGFLYAFPRSHWQQSLSMLFFQRFPSSKEVSMRTKQLNSSLSLQFGGGSEEWIEFACPCGNGKIIEQHCSIPGVYEHDVTIICDHCKQNYTFDLSKGIRAWELIEK